MRASSAPAASRSPMKPGVYWPSCRPEINDIRNEESFVAAIVCERHRLGLPRTRLLARLRVAEPEAQSAAQMGLTSPAAKLQTPAAFSSNFVVEVTTGSDPV